MLLNPHQLRATATPRRAQQACATSSIRSRAPVDADRLKRILRAQIYGSLLRLDTKVEKASEALRANDEALAAAIGCDIFASAGRIDRSLDRLRGLR
jgi:hypothetical protein